MRVIVKETRGIPTDYLREPSGTIEGDLEPHELSVVVEDLRSGWAVFWLVMWVGRCETISRW